MRALVAVAAVLLLGGCAALGPRPATSPIAMPAAAPTASPGSTHPARTAVTVPVVSASGTHPLGVAVLGAFAGDDSYWDGVRNGAKYRGLTPVWLVLQYRRAAGDGDHLVFTPITSDGSAATPLVFDLMGGSPQCGVREEDARDVPFDGVACQLIAMRHPSKLVAVEYRGVQETTVIAPKASDDPYVARPLRFLIPGGAKPVPAGAEGDG